MFKLFSQNKSCEIEKAENGWIVRIRNPRTLTAAPEDFQKQQLKVMGRIIALISKISAQEQVKGIDEELEPWRESIDDTEAIMKEIDRVIDTAFEKETHSARYKVEKEEETYVFSDLDGALNFVRKFFEG